MNTTPKNYPLILPVEGNPVDVGLTLYSSVHRVLSSPVLIARDGEEALVLIARWQGRETKTIVIALGLNMPCIDGFNILQTPKDHPMCGNIPTAILATSQGGHDICNVYELDANPHAFKQCISIILWKSRHKPNCNGAFIMNFQYK